MAHFYMLLHVLAPYDLSTTSSTLLLTLQTYKTKEEKILKSLEQHINSISEIDNKTIKK